MITINSLEELLNIVHAETEFFSFHKAVELDSAFRTLWDLTRVVVEYPLANKQRKQAMSKGICTYYENTESGVKAIYLVPKINLNSTSLYLVEIRGSSDNSKDVEKFEDLIAEIHKGHIDFMLKLGAEGCDCYDVAYFASFAREVYSICKCENTDHGDGALLDMYHAVINLYKPEALNQRFVTLFRNTGNTLNEVVKTLKSEGFKDSEIYKAMLVTMKDITWEE